MFITTGGERWKGERVKLWFWTWVKFQSINCSTPKIDYYVTSLYNIHTLSSTGNENTQTHEVEVTSWSTPNSYNYFTGKCAAAWGKIKEHKKEKNTLKHYWLNS